MNFAADTNPLRSAEYRVKFCSLCRTANHLLSRECFNCGWRGEFSSDSSGSPANPLWSEAVPPVSAQSLRSLWKLLRMRWKALVNWLFFIGRHRYGDDLLW